MDAFWGKMLNVVLEVLREELHRFGLLLGEQVEPQGHVIFGRISEQLELVCEQFIHILIIMAYDKLINIAIKLIKSYDPITMTPDSHCEQFLQDNCKKMFDTEHMFLKQVNSVTIDMDPRYSPGL